MSAHTPGPWTATIEFRHHNHKGGFDISAREMVICGRAGLPMRVDESAANARLIAAAPELLAACASVVALHEGLSDSQVGRYVLDCRAAIAKAEGRS